MTRLGTPNRFTITFFKDRLGKKLWFWAYKFNHGRHLRSTVRRSIFVMAKYLLIASISIITFLIIGRGSGMAECAAGDPTGHFQGTAVSKKAGKLDTSLDLRCVKQQYQGELITPVGVYTVSRNCCGCRVATAAGQRERYGHGTLPLRPAPARKQFAPEEDSSPVDLNRTGEPHQAQLDGAFAAPHSSAVAGRR